jgi:hypothetical protein
MPWNETEPMNERRDASAPGISGRRGTNGWSAMTWAGSRRWSIDPVRRGPIRTRWRPRPSNGSWRSDASIRGGGHDNCGPCSDDKSRRGGVASSELVGLHEVDDGRWTVYVGPIKLGVLDVRNATRRRVRHFGNSSGVTVRSRRGVDGADRAAPARSWIAATCGTPAVGG